METLRFSRKIWALSFKNWTLSAVAVFLLVQRSYGLFSWSYQLCSWSPDGKKIVYSGFSYGGHPRPKLFIMDSDGNNKRELFTNSRLLGMKPKFSPKGDLIAYIGVMPTGEYWEGIEEYKIGIWVMDVDGRNNRELAPLLVRIPKAALRVLLPPRGGYVMVSLLLNFDWSPDGNTIVYQDFDYLPAEPDSEVLFEYFKSSLWVVDIEEKRYIKVVDFDEKGQPSCPVWSPTGKEIAYLYPSFSPLPPIGAVWKEEEYCDVWTIDWKSRHKRNLTRNAETQNGSVYGRIAWSPDGSKIVYCCVLREGTGEEEVKGATCIVEVASSISHPVPFTIGSYLASPAWSPDGKMISARSMEAHDTSIIILDEEGGFINGHRDFFFCVWAPDSKRLLCISPNGAYVLIDIEGKSRQVLVEGF